MFTLYTMTAEVTISNSEPAITVSVLVHVFRKESMCASKIPYCLF